MGTARGCSHPGCDEVVKYDLVLSERYNNVRRLSNGGSYVQSCKMVAHHLYLCEEHGKDVLDFMEAYEGKE